MLLNNEQAFINWYVAEREYNLTYNVRKALNFIFHLMSKKKYNRAAAITIASNTYKKNGYDFSRQFLGRMYNKRSAYIKNAKDKFKQWEYEKRLSELPMNQNEEKLCECGCGSPAKKGNRFINGHNIRCKSKHEKDLQASKMREAKKSKNISNVFYLDRKIS